MPRFRYNDRNSFLSLWLMDQYPTEPIEIEWSGHPEQTSCPDVHLMNHLTPLDWVVSYILRFPDRVLPNVLLDDKRSGDCKNQQESWFALRWQKTLTSELVPGLLLLSRPQPAPNGLAGGAVSSESRLRIKELWRSRYLLRGSGDHHSAANILGGLCVGEDTLPAGAAGAAGAPVEIKALRAHLRYLGFVSKAEPQQAAQGSLPRPQFPRWLLVDDMARIGWESFVALRLGANGGRVCDSYEDFKKIANEIGTRLQKKSHERWAETAGPVNGDHLRGRDIVLLDLYLTHNPTKKAWRENLQVILDSPQCSLNSDEKIALEAVQALPDDRKDALFPALMALAFPLLPIVLFSSTEQRDVIQALSPFPNIIVDFQKPTLSLALSGTDYRAHAIKALDRALKQAGRVCTLGKEVKILADKAAKSTTNQRPAELKGKTVEIYFDESGNHNDRHIIRRVGALIAVYPDDAVADGIEAKIVARPSYCVGFSSAQLAGTLRRPSTFSLKVATGDKLLPHVKRVVEGHNNRNIELFYARIEIKGDCPDREKAFPDPTFFNLLRAIIEALIYDWLSVSPNILRIFPATRICTSRREPCAEAWKQFAGLGQKDDRIYLLSQGTAHLIVNPIVEMHDYRHIDSMRQVAAVNLTYYEDYQSCDLSTYVPPPRQLHYLADVVADGSYDRDLENAGVRPVLKASCTWKELRDGADSWVQHLREASRYVDRGQPVKAFLAWCAAEKAMQIMPQPSLGSWPGYVAERVWESLQQHLSLTNQRQMIEELRP